MFSDLELEKRVYVPPTMVEYGSVIKLTGSGSDKGLDAAGGKNNSALTDLDCDSTIGPVIDCDSSTT